MVVTPETALLPLNGEQLLTAELSGREIGDATWSVSDTTVVRLESDGLLHARGLGTAIVQVSAGEGSASATVVVREGFVGVTAGDKFTCGTTESGATGCWGGDFYGQQASGRSPAAAISGRAYEVR
jgi:hypothetical protein